jgi:hypothetical protein
MISYSTVPQTAEININNTPLTWCVPLWTLASDVLLGWALASGHDAVFSPFSTAAQQLCHVIPLPPPHQKIPEHWTRGGIRFSESRYASCRMYTEPELGILRWRAQVGKLFLLYPVRKNWSIIICPPSLPDDRTYDPTIGRQRPV